MLAREDFRALLLKELLQGGKVGAFLQQEVRALLLEEVSRGGEVEALLGLHAKGPQVRER